MSEQPKILIVDDRAENLFTLEKVLRKLPVTIIQANCGAAALALALEHSFFVAIVDVQMPDMDGYELVELLRGNETTAILPVIFVSAIFSDEYHHRKGYDAGAVDFLSKPFVPEILLSKVRVFLDLYRQRQRLQEVVAQLNSVNAEVQALNETLERKVRERTAAMERAYDDLALLDRGKSDFIEIISHELRTPLSLVVGYSEILLETPLIASNERYRQQVQAIVNGADRISEIVASMLDIVRIDSRALELDYQPLSLSLLFSGQQQLLATACQERNLTLTIDALDALPEIEADTGSLVKVFSNLLLNAIKYTPDGGAITVSGHYVPLDDVAGGFVEVIISDTGIGIDPTAHDLIFTKFFQAGPVAFHSSGKTKFKGGGPGLGLTVARGIVEAHGGKIWAESSGYDETTCPGSEFHVLLPLHPGLTKAAAVTQRALELVSVSTSEKG